MKDNQSIPDQTSPTQARKMRRKNKIVAALLFLSILLILFGGPWLLFEIESRNKILGFRVWGITFLLLAPGLLLVALINLNTRFDNWFNNFLVRRGVSKNAILFGRRGIPSVFFTAPGRFGFGGGPYKSKLYGLVMLISGFFLIFMGTSVFLDPSMLVKNETARTKDQYQQQVEKPGSQTSNVAENTKIYNNVKYGFQFSYPKESNITWEEDSNNAFVVIVGGTPDLEGRNAIYDKNYFKLLIRKQSCLETPRTTGKIIISDHKVDYFEGDWGLNRYIGYACLTRNGYSYEISFDLYDPTESNKIIKRNLFNQVSSTFKFNQ